MRISFQCHLLLISKSTVRLEDEDKDVADFMLLTKQRASLPNAYLYFDCRACGADMAQKHFLSRGKFGRTEKIQESTRNRPLGAINGKVGIFHAKTPLHPWLSITCFHSVYMEEDPSSLSGSTTTVGNFFARTLASFSGVVP